MQFKQISIKLSTFCFLLLGLSHKLLQHFFKAKGSLINCMYQVLIQIYLGDENIFDRGLSQLSCPLKQNRKLCEVHILSSKDSSYHYESTKTTTVPPSRVFSCLVKCNTARVVPFSTLPHVPMYGES